MSSRILICLKRSTQLLVCIVLLTVPCHAGVLGLRTSAVGGISISVDGIVGPASVDAKKRLLEEMRKEIRSPEGEINVPVQMRMISLRALESACQEAVRNVGRVPDEIRFLAGIQRIQYVFVYPEDNDIVLAGPGEGWKVDANACVVGVTTGRPVLLLDDLLVALRSVEEARQGGITASIDPTEEGTRRLNDLLARQKSFQNATTAMMNEFESAMKQAFGPQRVTVTGVPAHSHFARVLVAADYRMKRIAMKLDASPVRELTSYLDIIGSMRSSSYANARPRWWLACNYEPLAASPDGLAWELRGPGVKAMTEDEAIVGGGKRVQTGRTSFAAQKWADLMTDQYDSLAGRDPVFGELRNLMDMCVVAALIQKEQLAEKAGLSIPVLSDANSELKIEVWNAPKTIPPEVSYLRGKDSLIVTASGGVAVESWQVADRKEVVANVSQVREKAARGRRTSLWW
jgi:hypothetical protein